MELVKINKIYDYKLLVSEVALITDLNGVSQYNLLGVTSENTIINTIIDKLDIENRLVVDFKGVLYKFEIDDFPDSAVILSDMINKHQIVAFNIIEDISKLVD